MSNNSEAGKEIKKAEKEFKYLVETWEEFEKTFRDNTDGYYDPFPELIKLVGDRNLKNKEEIEAMTKALKSGRSESSIEGYLGQLKDAAARKGLQIYAVNSPEGSGRTLRLVDKNLDFKTMFTRFKVLQKQRSEAEKQEYELLKKVIEATPSIDLMKYDKFGRGVNQHVRVQSREAIVLNSNDEIMSIQNTTLGLKKLINKMKDMPVVQVNNLNDTKISTYIDQMKQMKKELNYIWQKELESQQMLSAQRVKNTAYNRDQGDIFENATAYTETAQFFGALSYDLVPVMNQLWAKFHNTTEFRKKYQRKSFYRNMKDVVDFQRDFNEVVTTAMMYANPVYQDEGVKKFQEYLKIEKPHFGVMRKSLDSLFEYIKNSGTTHGMRSEGSTGNLNQMKIPTIASALVAESDVKGKKNSLANVVQERTSKYALKNPFKSLIKEIKRQPGEEAYYLRGEITEQDLLEAYQEFIEGVFNKNIGKKKYKQAKANKKESYKEFLKETFRAKEGTNLHKRVAFDAKTKTIKFIGTEEERKEDKARWKKELKEHPELMNFMYGLTNDQAIVRSSLRNQDLVNLYTIPKEIKSLDYEKFLDDLKKSASGDRKDFNKFLDKLTKKSWNIFKESLEKESAEKIDWGKNPELISNQKQLFRSIWEQKILTDTNTPEGKLINETMDIVSRFSFLTQEVSEQIFDNVLASSFFGDSLGPGSSIASTEKTDEGGLSVIIKQKTKPYIAKLMGVNTAGIRQGSVFTYDKIIDILIKNVYGNSEFAKNISFFRQRVAKIQQKNIATYVDEGARRLGLQLSMKWKKLEPETRRKILNTPEIRKSIERFFKIEGTEESSEISLQERVFNQDGKLKNPLQQALKHLNIIAKAFYDKGIIEEESLFTFDAKNGQYYLPKTWIGAGQLAIASNEKLSTPNNIKHGFKEERALRDLASITGTNIKDIFPRYIEDLQNSPEYGFYKKQVETLLALSFNTDEDTLKKMTMFNLDSFKDMKRIDSDAYLRSGSIYATKEEIKSLPSVIFAQKVLEDLKEKAINIEDIESIDQLFKDKKYGIQLGQYFAKNLNGKTGAEGVGLGDTLPLFMDLEFLKSVASIQNDLETAEDNKKLELNYIDSMRVMDAVVQNINDIKQDYKLDALKKQEYIGNLVADYVSSLNENVNTDEGTIFERYNKIALKGSRMLKDASLSYKELPGDKSYDFLMSDKVWMKLAKESLLSLDDQDERDKKILEMVGNSIKEAGLDKDKLLKDEKIFTGKKQIGRIYSKLTGYGNLESKHIKQLAKKYFSDRTDKSLNLLLKGVANRATLKNDGTAESFIWALINRFPSIAGMDVMPLKGQLVRGNVLRDHIAINPDLQRAFNADNDGDIIATAVIMGEIDKLNKMHEYTDKVKKYADILLKEDLKFISPGDESKITSSGGAPMETEKSERNLEQEAKKKAFIDAQVQEGKRSIGLFSYLNTGVAETLKQKGYLASNLLPNPEDTNVTRGAVYGDILRGFLTTLEQDAISAKKIGDVYDKAVGESEKAKKEVADELDGIKRAQNIIIDSTNWTQANFHKVLEEARKILGKQEDESLLNNRVLTLLAAKAEQIGGAYSLNFKKILGINENDSLDEYVKSDKFKGITGDQLTKVLFGDEQKGISGLGAALSQGIFKQFRIRELIEKAHQYIPGRAYPYFNMTSFERRNSQEERDFIQFVTSDKEEVEFLKQTLGEIEQTYNGYKTLSEWAGSRQASFKKVLKEIVKQEKDFHDFKSHVSPHSLIHDFLPSKYGQGVSPEISKDIFEQQILEKGKTFEQLQSEFGYSEDFLQSFLESQILFSQGKIVHAAQESVGNKKVSLEEMRKIFQKKGSPIEKPLAEYLMLLKSSKNQKQTAELDDETNKELESLMQLSLGGNKLNQALSNYGYNIIGQELVSGGYLQKKAVSGISDVLFFKEATDTERAKLMIGDYKTNKGAVLPSDILQTIIYGGLFKQIQADIQEQFKEKGAGDFEAYLESGSAVAESLIKNFEHTATVAGFEENSNEWKAEIERQKKKWMGDEKDPNNPGIFNILKNNEQLDYLGAILHLSPLTGTGEIKTFNMFGPRDTVPWGALAALEAGRSLTPEMEEELKGAVSTFYSTDIEGIEDKTKTKDSLIAKLTEEQKEELKKYQATKEKILKIREEQRKLNQQLDTARLTVDDEKAAKIQEQILSNQKELEELGSSKFITEGSGLNQKQNLADLKTIIDAEFENKESKQKANEFISSATRVKNRNEIFDINIKKLRKTTPELLKIKTSISELESIKDFRELTEEEESTLDDLKESSKTIEEKIHRLQLGIEEIIDEQQESVDLLKSAQKSTQKTVIKTNKKYNKSEKGIAQDKFKNLSRQLGSGSLFESTDIIEQSILDKRRQYKSYSPDGLENKEKLAQEEASLIRRKEDLKDLKKWRSLLSAVSKSEDEVQKIREDLRKTSDTQEQQLLQEQLDAAEIVLEHNRNQVEEFKRQRGKEINGEFVWNSSREEQIYEQANTLTNAEGILKKKKEREATSSSGLFGSLDNSLISWFSRFFSGGILVKGLQVFLKEVRNMINQAKELDKVMTNVRIVTNDSVSDTRNLISEYSKLGKELGVTTKEIAQSGIEWMRQGYQAAEANKLIKASLYLSKLGMIDSTTATQSLTSALKGFKLEAADAMSVVDKLTAIDLKAATSAGDIAQGLSQFANIGSLAGVDIDQAAAYVATIADVTQMSGASAGQSLKTIISRYGNVKAGAYNQLNIDSEGSDTSENLNDVEKVLSKIGISIRDSNLEFKDFDDVLGEIAEKWNSLDNVSKRAIAGAFAGIRQQESFLTLLSNWDKYEELLDVSRSSAGTAEIKYQSVRESLEASINKLQVTIESFVNKAELSNLLKVLVDLGTHLAEWIPKIIKYLPVVFSAVQNLKIFSGDSISQKVFGKFFKPNEKNGNSLFKEEKRQKKKAQKKEKEEQEKIAKNIEKQEELSNTLVKNQEKITNESTKQVSNQEEISKNKKVEVQQVEQITQQSQVAARNSEIAKNNEQKETNLTDEQVRNAKKAENSFEEIKNDSQAAANNIAKNGKTTETNGVGGKGTLKNKGVGGVKGQAASAAASAALSYVFNQLVAGFTAYETSGTTHKNRKGEEVQSSEAARERGRTIIGSWTTALPIFGQFIGEHIAESVMQEIDKDRDEANILAEEANKILDSINSTKSDFSTLKKMTGPLQNSDIELRDKTIESFLNNMYSQENNDYRNLLQGYLGDILKDLDVTTTNGSDLNSLMEAYQQGDEKSQQKIIRSLEIAQKRAEQAQQTKLRAAEQYSYEQNIREKQLSYNATKPGYTSLGITNEQEADAVATGKETGWSVGTSVFGGATAAGAAVGTLFGPGVGTLIGAGVGALVGLIGGGIAGIFAGNKATEAKRLEYQQQIVRDNRSLQEKIKDLNKEEQKIRGEIQTLDETQNKTNETAEKIANYNKQLVAIEQYRQSLQDYSGYVALKQNEANKSYLEEALLRATIGDNKEFLTNLNYAQLKGYNREEIYRALGTAVGNNLGGMSVETDGVLTEDFIEMATTVLKTDAEIAQYLSGESYTLKEAINNLNSTDRFEKEILKNFANALNVSSLDKDSAVVNSFGNLTLGELLQSPAELNKTVEQYSSLISSISDSTQSISEWMSIITKQFPDLIQYMDDVPALMNATIEKIKELSQWELQSRWEELAGDSKFFETTVKEDLNKYISTLSSERQTEIQKLITESGAQNFKSLITYVSGKSLDGDENVEELINAIKTVGSDYKIFSDEYQDSLKRYIDANINKLDEQIKLLSDQRDSLQQISQQREYENKLMEARLQLENAQNEKKRVYRSGVGWTYESDQKKIEEAQKNLEDLKTEKEISALDKQIEVLNSMKESWSSVWTDKDRETLNSLANSFENAFGVGENNIYAKLDKIVGEGGLIEGLTTDYSTLTAQVLETNTNNLRELLYGKTDDEGKTVTSGIASDVSGISNKMDAISSSLSETGNKVGIISSSLSKTDPDKKSLAELWQDYVDAMSSDASGDVKNSALLAFLNRADELRKNGYDLSNWTQQLKDGKYSVTKTDEEGKTVSVKVGDTAGTRTIDNVLSGGYLKNKELSEKNFGSIMDDDDRKRKNLSTDETTLVDPNYGNWIVSDMKQGGSNAVIYTLDSQGNISESRKYTMTELANSADPNLRKLLPTDTDTDIYEYAQRIRDLQPNGIIAIGLLGYNEMSFIKNGQPYAINSSDAVSNKDDEISGSLTSNVKWKSDQATLVSVQDGKYIISDIVNKKKAAFYILSEEGNTATKYTMDANNVPGDLIPTSATQSIEDYARQIYKTQKYNNGVIVVGTDGENEYALIKDGYAYNITRTTHGVRKHSSTKGTSRGSRNLASGTFNSENGIHLINELGPEALVTPSGTLTALPAHTGVVPADITKNLWSLGELAPSILRALQMNVLSDFKPTSGLTNSLDESLNVNNLTMNVNTGGSFDARQFVQSLKEQAALTRNLR